MFYRDAALYIGQPGSRAFQVPSRHLPVQRHPDPGAPTGIPSADIDTVVLCDTPKPSMIEASPAVRELLKDPSVLRDRDRSSPGRRQRLFRRRRVPIRHGGLLGERAHRPHPPEAVKGRTELLERHQITELFPRNLVLAILTGIIGDSNMGQYLKSRREKKYYQIFSGDVQRDALPADDEEVELLHHGPGFHRAAEALHARGGLLQLHDGTEARVRAPSAWWRSPRQEMAPLYASCDDDTIVSTARVIADTSGRGKRQARSGRLLRQPDAQRAGAVPSAARRCVEEVRPAGLCSRIFQSPTAVGTKGRSVSASPRRDRGLPRLRFEAG